MRFLTAGLRSVFSGIVPTIIWALAVGTSFLLEIALLYSDDTDPLNGFALLVGLGALIGAIFAQWKMTRALGEATADERGSVGAWIGWSLAAYLPAILIVCGGVAVLGIDTFYDRFVVAHWWSISALFTATAALIVPVSVHAVGRAIDATGPSLSHCFHACAPVYLPLAFAYFIATSLCYLASDWLLEIAPADRFDMDGILLSLVATLPILIAFAWSTAIAASVWRTIVKGQSAQSG